MTDIRTTPGIDVTGPDEDPLRDSGAWRRLSSNAARPLELRRSSNTLTSQGHPTAQSGYIAGSYYTRAVFSGDHVEVWACTAGGQLGAALETWRIGLYADPEGLNGYTAFYGGGLSKFYLLSRIGGPGIFIGGGIVGGSYPGMLLLRLNGDDVELWASFDAGANWTLMLSMTDTTYRANLYLSLEIEDPTNGGLYFDCFGGGTKNRTQFFRFMRN